MNIQAAWRLGYTGKEVVVSILDDGLETQHPDLKQNYVRTPHSAAIIFPIEHTYLCYCVTIRTQELVMMLTEMTLTQRHDTMQQMKTGLNKF